MVVIGELSLPVGKRDGVRVVQQNYPSLLGGGWGPLDIFHLFFSFCKIVHCICNKELKTNTQGRSKELLYFIEYNFLSDYLPV
jgi:hypothetical protein